MDRETVHIIDLLAMHVENNDINTVEVINMVTSRLTVTEKAKTQYRGYTRGPNAFYFRGIEYASISQAAKVYGVARQQIYSTKSKHGLNSNEEALEYIVSRREKKSTRVDDVSKQQVYNTKVKHGFSTNEEAYEYIVSKRKLRRRKKKGEI